MSKMEEARIDIIKPVTIKIRLNGWARREDDKMIINWFDNTVKIIGDVSYIQYHENDFNLALQQVVEIYRRNQKSIKSIKLSTI